MKKFLLVAVPPAIVGYAAAELMGFYSLFITLPLAFWWGGYAGRRW